MGHRWRRRDAHGTGIGWLAGVAAVALAVSLQAPTRAPASVPRPAPPGGTLLGQTLQEFAGRRAAVLSAAGGAPVILQAPTENEDIDRERFRSDNDFVYLTGVDAPGAWLALLPAVGSTPARQVLFLPPQSPYRSRWMDAVLAPGEEAQRLTGIGSVRSVEDLWDTLRPSIVRARILYVTGPVGERARYTRAGQTATRIQSLNPDVQIRDVGPLIHALRYVKSPGELANLRAAVAATADGERAAARAIAPGTTEIAVEGAILAAFRKADAPREGFPSIVGSGPNSVILHHFSSDRTMQPGEMVVVDIGAEFNYYTGDLTRTFPCGGRFTPRQRELYQLVLDTQRACERAVVPGRTTLRELNRKAQETLRGSSLRAKDTNGNERTMDAFFFHAIGHPLGMDVHDVSGDDEVLRPGVVFTIEPGVYVAREGIGIRIEDDYLVTQDGVEKLSKALPSDPDAVEAMMAGSR